MCKFLKTAAISIVTAAVAMFVSCSSNSNIVHEWIEEPNPENSVLVFGFDPEVSEFEVAQINEKYPADYHSAIITKGVINLGFLQPDTEYQMVYAFERSGNTYFSSFTNLDTKMFTFKVPSKPGIHFIGSFSIIQSIRDKELTPLKYNLIGTDLKDQENIERRSIEVLLKKYKGTPWESALQERHDELEAIINAR